MNLTMNLDLEKTANVPCNGCTLCCQYDIIMLFPEHGDDVASYETEEFTLPGTNETGRVLKKGADGKCIYLDEHGCTIHERSPLICRSFDCRKWFQSKTRSERRYLIKNRLADKAIFARGRELLPTLSE